MTRATSRPPNVVELTFDEYMATPLMRSRHDVIDGVIVMCPAPTYDHQFVGMAIYRPLFDFAERRNLGTVMAAPFDVLIRREPKLRTRQPDVAFFSAARVSRPALREWKIAEIAPDLAVEIRSEQESEARWLEKLEDYAAIGVAEVWRVFLQTETVQVLALEAGRYEPIGLFHGEEMIRSRVLPGLAITVVSCFA